MGTASLVRRYITFPAWVAKNQSPRLRYMHELEHTQYESLGRLQKLQLDKLLNLVQHAYDHCDFYRERFDRAGFNPKELRELSDLKRIPILKKDDIRHHGDQMIANAYKGSYLSRFKTGGSTGVPVVVMKDKDTVELGNSAGLRAFRWTGWKIGEPWGLVWGNPPELTSIKQKLLNALTEPVIYLDTMELTEDTMMDFLQRWRKVRPTIMRGHSHSIYIFASFCLSKAISDIRPTGIVSSSMMLLPSERRVIEQAFQCKVTDLYGCEEVGLIASECEKHDGMHVNMENVYVEILDENDQHVPPNKEGAVVVTSLINHAMPLIRYKIGDVSSFREDACACGRTLPLMNNVSGRVADFFVRRDGSVVAGVSLVERTLTAFPGIAQMQMIQEDLDTIRLRLVRDRKYTEEVEKAVIEEMKNLVGKNNSIKVEYVDRIKPEPSGKYRFAVSKIQNPFSDS